MLVHEQSTVFVFIIAMGGQGGEEEDEQKQCESPEHTAPEDPQIQQGL